MLIDVMLCLLILTVDSQGDEMCEETDLRLENAELRQTNAALRDRLLRLSVAGLRINSSFDLGTVLQEVVDSATSLTGGRVGCLGPFDETGLPEAMYSSGLSQHQHKSLLVAPGGLEFLNHLCAMDAGAGVIHDLGDFIRVVGLPELKMPLPVHSMLWSLCRVGSRITGLIAVGREKGDREFSEDDSETLALFASQAALVISNAQRYADEQKARKRLETLIDTTPIGVAVFERPMGERFSFNREAARIFQQLCNPGQQPESLLDTMSVRRADGRIFSLSEVPIAEILLSTADTVRTEEIYMSVPNGKSIRTLVNATPIVSEDGQIETVVVTFQDMSDVEEVARLRAEFLGMVSHELRTPLTSIKGSTTTLLDPSENLTVAEREQFHRIIDSQTDRMRSLVGDLLDVAHIETGTLSVIPEPSDIVALVDTARGTFLAGGGRGELEFSVQGDIPPVMADRQRIVQVLVNLLSNAEKYSPHQLPIQIEATRQEELVEVSVSDQGHGIPAERMATLFRRFMRSERDEEYLGSGLGLAICKGIVEAHGGRIWAESDGPGKGSCFRFTLPMAESVMSRSHLRPDWISTQIEPFEERPRVLVVDDNPETLRYVRDTLNKSGYTPIVTGDPLGAVRLMAENDPNLILLDMMLPGTNGVELMKDLMVISNVPVIFLSAYGQDDIVASAYEMGAADYIVKPFSPAELAARIGAVLRREEESKPELPTEPYEFGELRIDYAAHRATLSGNPLSLTDIEYRMMVEMSINPGRVLSYNHLLDRVWGRGRGADLRPMRTVVKSLRRKLGDHAANPKYLFTEPRVGYRLGD